MATSRPLPGTAAMRADADASDAGRLRAMPGSAPPARMVGVDVRGEVNSLGYYSLPEGSRVSDAIKAAGGLKPGTVLADTTVNLAEKVSDGQVVNITAVPPTPPPPPAKRIQVHIRGEVVSPGVYSVDDGACVNDLVMTAGGLKPDTVLADTVNLAAQVSDGQVVNITAVPPAPPPPKPLSLVTTTRATTNIPEPPGVDAMSRLLQRTDPRIAEEKACEERATAEKSAKTASTVWWWRTLVVSGVLLAFTIFGIMVVAWIAGSGAGGIPLASIAAVGVGGLLFWLVVSFLRTRRNEREWRARAEEAESELDND